MDFHHSQQIADLQIRVFLPDPCKLRSLPMNGVVIFMFSVASPLQPKAIFSILTLLKKWAIPGLFLFISILFKHKYYRKTLCFSKIRTRIVRVEGDLADHLTTTTAPYFSSQHLHYFWVTPYR